MEPSESFEMITRALRQYESEGRAVDLVGVTTCGNGDGDSLVATVDVSLPLYPTDESGGAVEPQSAFVDDDGTLQVTFPSPAAAPDLDDAEAMSVTEEAAWVTDGTVFARVEIAVDLGANTDRAVTDDVDEFDAASGADGAAETTRCTESDDSGHATESCESNADDSDEVTTELAAARNEALPPYEDTEYLQCLYDAFGTFDEMAERIEMDVASETVRRYMIDAGIHEPTSYDTDAETDRGASEPVDDNGNGASTTDEPEVSPPDESEERTDVSPDTTPVENSTVDNVSDKQIVTDGIGLPDGLQIDDVVDAVVDSMTLYEFQQELDLGRSEAQDLLRQLNLLDLVMRRVSQNPEEPPSYELVATRIREGAAGA